MDSIFSENCFSCSSMAFILVLRSSCFFFMSSRIASFVDLITTWFPMIRETSPSVFSTSLIMNSVSFDSMEKAFFCIRSCWKVCSSIWSSWIFLWVSSSRFAKGLVVGPES